MTLDPKGALRAPLRGSLCNKRRGIRPPCRLLQARQAIEEADPTTQRWWVVCKPCQEPLSNRAEGEWWAGMEEVFHCD
jgi:hypothetical protein